VASPVAFSSKSTGDQPPVDSRTRAATSDKPSRIDDREQGDLLERPSTPTPSKSPRDQSYSETFDSPSRLDNDAIGGANTAGRNEGADEPILGRKSIAAFLGCFFFFTVTNLYGFSAVLLNRKNFVVAIVKLLQFMNNFTEQYWSQ
jgi:hypothetical protein